MAKKAKKAKKLLTTKVQTVMPIWRVGRGSAFDEWHLEPISAVGFALEREFQKAIAVAQAALDRSIVNNDSAIRAGILHVLKHVLENNATASLAFDGGTSLAVHLTLAFADDRMKDWQGRIVIGTENMDVVTRRRYAQELRLLADAMDPDRPKQPSNRQKSPPAVAG